MKLNARPDGRTWVPYAQGATVGLFTSRLLTESAPSAWQLAHLLPLIGICVILSLFAVRMAQGRIRESWPIFLLLGYVIWPQAWSGLAWSLAFVVACLLLMLNWPPLVGREGMRGYLYLEAIVFLTALALYVSTLAPGVLPADSGEFQLVCGVLGIAHPPGYPLYTMLGKLFTLLPIGDVAYRVNLFAAICGALAVAVVAGSVRHSTQSAIAALVAAIALGLSTTYWAQSTMANIRSLTALFVALCLALGIRWGETRSQRHLIAWAICFGLGVGHHSSIGLLGIPFLAYLMAVEPSVVLQPRRWIGPLGGVIASLLVLLYLPIRSLIGAPFDPAPIRSWAGFLEHVLALGFRGDMFYFRTVPELAARGGIWLNIIFLQFGMWLPIAFASAMIPLILRDRRTLLLLASTWVINTLAAVTYRAPQTVEYLMPSYVALAMLLGQGLGTLLRARTGQALPQVAAALLLLAALSNGAANYPNFRQLHTDTSAQNYAKAILCDAPPEAVILSNWHRATVFWYLQQLEGVRPDVQVRYVYPEGATPNEAVWLRRIAEDIEQHPVIVTNQFHAFRHTNYRWIPFHDAWLVCKDALTSPPPEIIAQKADFEEGIRLLGYQTGSRVLKPGQVLTVRIYWQATAPLQRDYSSFVQLLGPNGVVGQSDLVHRANAISPQEVRVDAYELPLLLHAQPGEYQLITGFYYQSSDGWRRLIAQGVDYVTLTTVMVRPAQQPASTRSPLDERFANGLCLVGADYDRSITGQIRLYLHWQMPKVALDARSSRSSLPQPVRVRALSGGGIVAEAALPTLSRGEAATIVMDLPDHLQEVALALADLEDRAIARLGPWHYPTSRQLRLALPRGKAHYVPLGGEMVFLGFERLTSSAERGEDLALRPRFLSLRPLMTDYAVSVGLANRSAGWEGKSDSTPALGAIPTLKWVRGWVISDPHAITVPTSAPPGTAAATLTVYDAFTLEPLGVLDERLVRLGQGTALQLGQVDIR